MTPRFMAHTDPGLLRTVNQDDYHIDPQERFCIVADGMGGHAGGQEASQIATSAIQHYLDQYWDDSLSSPALLEKALLEANEAILRDQSTHPERADMGTTAVVVIFRADQVWAAHIGDSRLYRLREQTLEQITDDHTWVARAMKAGDITAEQAKIHPWRHVLSQCLGRKDLQEIDIQTMEVHPGDRLLLCSDGLTEELSDTLILKHLVESSLEKAPHVLVEAAKEKGGRDNITVVLVEMGR